MKPTFLARLAALSGAAILAVGAISLWVSADSQKAGATTAPPPAARQMAADIAEPAPLTPDPPKPRNKEEQRFARADKDDDGRITQAEYLQQRRRNFDKLDTNGDGRLGFEEYAASGVDKFRKADRDGNGSLVATEFATTAPKPKNRQTASVDACRCPSAHAAASPAESQTD
jgi:hypothetical protein